MKSRDSSAAPSAVVDAAPITAVAATTPAIATSSAAAPAAAIPASPFPPSPRRAASIGGALDSGATVPSAERFQEAKEEFAQVLDDHSAAKASERQRAAYQEHVAAAEAAAQAEIHAVSQRGAIGAGIEPQSGNKSSSESAAPELSMLLAKGGSLTPEEVARVKQLMEEHKNDRSINESVVVRDLVVACIFMRRQNMKTLKNILAFTCMLLCFDIISLNFAKQELLFVLHCLIKQFFVFLSTANRRPKCTPTALTRANSCTVSSTARAHIATIALPPPLPTAGRLRFTQGSGSTA